MSIHVKKKGDEQASSIRYHLINLINGRSCSDLYCQARLTQAAKRQKSKLTAMPMIWKDYSRTQDIL
jgi:hypothetical protein